MPGCFTPAQMDALRKANGARTLDRLFLTGMIQHHNGAAPMVKDCSTQPAAGQDAELFNFATDADNSQRAEIRLWNPCSRKHERGETMNRTSVIGLRVAGAALIFFRREPLYPQAPAPATRLRRTTEAKESEEEHNPLLLSPLPHSSRHEVPTPAIPAPNLRWAYNAAETSMASIISCSSRSLTRSTRLSDRRSEVQKTIAQLGTRPRRKAPEPTQLVHRPTRLRQLRTFAFQRQPPVPGKFLW